MLRSSCFVPKTFALKSVREFAMQVGWEQLTRTDRNKIATEAARERAIAISWRICLDIDGRCSRLTGKARSHCKGTWARIPIRVPGSEADRGSHYSFLLQQYSPSSPLLAATLLLFISNLQGLSIAKRSENSDTSIFSSPVAGVCSEMGLKRQEELSALHTPCSRFLRRADRFFTYVESRLEVWGFVNNERRNWYAA